MGIELNLIMLPQQSGECDLNLAASHRNQTGKLRQGRNENRKCFVVAQRRRAIVHHAYGIKVGAGRGGIGRHPEERPAGRIDARPAGLAAEASNGELLNVTAGKTIKALEAIGGSIRKENL